MAKKRPTVQDVRANKGKYQYTMMRVESWDELAAAEAAGIDMVSVSPDMMADKQFRQVAPTLFAIPGMALYSAPATTDDYLRWAFRMMEAGADAVYCAASFQTVERMAAESIPVIGHVGLIPHFCTWTGGFKAVGKTAESAIQVHERCKRYEQAGAFGVEIEVVPPEVTAEISRHTSLFLVSMGGGAGGD
jgi:3-methyl-2-oxobutanoate hydroxymethyltransferase